MALEHVAQQLTTVGAGLMRPAALNGCLDINDSAWTQFAAHWEDLASDSYAAELGTRRLSRYGHFVFRPADTTLEPTSHSAFVQPEDSNPLYIGTDRHFEPLTDSFAKDPLLQQILKFLGRLATALDD